MMNPRGHLWVLLILAVCCSSIYGNEDAIQDSDQDEDLSTNILDEIVHPENNLDVYEEDEEIVTEVPKQNQRLNIETELCSDDECKWTEYPTDTIGNKQDNHHLSSMTDKPLSGSLSEKILNIDFDLENSDVCNVYLKSITRNGTLDLKVLAKDLEPNATVVFWNWNTEMCGTPLFIVRINKINGTAEERAFNTTYTRFRVTNLSPCTRYSVQVATNNLTFHGEFSLPINSEIVPRSEPSASRDEIFLHWGVVKINEQEANQSCSCKIISDCKNVAVLGKGYEPKDGQTETEMTEDATNYDVKVSGLSPFSSYHCKAKIKCEGTEFETDNHTVEIVTMQDVPRFNDDNIPWGNTTGNNKIIFQWNPPNYLPGKILEYETLINSSSMYKPHECMEKNRESKEIRHDSRTLLIERELKPFFNYTFQVRAKTEAGWGDYSRPFVYFNNDMSRPGRVRNFRIQITEPEAGFETIIRWDVPCEINGHLEYFVISVVGTLRNLIRRFERTVTAHDNWLQTTSYSLDLTKDLEQNYLYNISVATKISNFDELGIPDYRTLRLCESAKRSSYNLVISNVTFVAADLSWDTVCAAENYTVIVKSEDETAKNWTTTETAFSLEGLIPCSRYDINVVPSNHPETTIPKKFNTMLMDPPKKYNFLSSNYHISIDWITNNTNDRCECKLITFCNISRTLGTGYEMKNGSAETALIKHVKKYSVNVVNLSPFSVYKCNGKIRCKNLETAESETFEVTTREDVPRFNDDNVPWICPMDNHTVKLIWKSPNYVPGFIIRYEILEQFSSLYRPSAMFCKISDKKYVYEKIPMDGNESIKFAETSSEYLIDVKPFTNHTIKIKAQTKDAGWGDYGKPISYYHNVPSVPGPVNYLRLDVIPRETTFDAVLKWEAPCDLNGQLEFFVVSVQGTLLNETQTFSRKVYPHENWYEETAYQIDLTDDLFADCPYTFTVATKVFDVHELGPDVNTSYEIPAAVPVPPRNDLEFKRLEMTTLATRSSAEIALPLFTDMKNGQIVRYVVTVVKKGFGKSVQTRLPYQDMYSWHESKSADFELTYQATDLNWDYRKQETLQLGDITVMKFVIGADEDCEKIDPNLGHRVYCNGPLNPDTTYEVRIRGFTDGGFADSPAFILQTKPTYLVSLILGSIFGAIFCGLIITLFMIVRKKRFSRVLQRFLNSGYQPSQLPGSMSHKKFLARCQQLSDNPEKLADEFQLLRNISVNLRMSTTVACLPENRSKNRYSDIMPYDFSRVPLDLIDNDPTTDYINASFVKGITDEYEYIACQGPKQDTSYDFWRMIDQYDIKLIVMLTRLVENGKEKCYRYFPNVNHLYQYQDMTIKCIEELNFRTFVRRTFILQKDDREKEICHMQFKNWPDHGVPDDFDPIIQFCHMMRKEVNNNRGLIVAHCSAGIGRTGTLLAIDILLQQIKENKKLNVFKTVFMLRTYRINMVQRESQYAYIYFCIRQILKRGDYCHSSKEMLQRAFDASRLKLLEPSLSEMELINNSETITNGSTPTDSKKLICDSPLSSPFFIRNKTSNNALRPCKSTSAIYTKLKSIPKFGSYNFPVYELNSPSESSGHEDYSLSESTDSLYENVAPLSRSKSDQMELHCTTHEWLEKDTLV